MRFFPNCIPCQPSESGVVISSALSSPSSPKTNDDDYTIQKQTQQQLSSKTVLSSSLAVGFVNPLRFKSVNNNSTDNATTDYTTTTTTAPNTPESITSTITPKLQNEVTIIKAAQSMDSSVSTTDQQEFYVDDDNDDDDDDQNSYKNIQELNKLKTKLIQLQTLDDSLLEIDSNNSNDSDEDDVTENRIVQVTKFDNDTHVTPQKQQIIITATPTTPINNSPDTPISKGSSHKMDRIVARSPTTYEGTFYHNNNNNRTGTRNIQVIDCTNDEYEIAYKTWYYRGLLLFRPKSIPSPNIIDLDDDIRDTDDIDIDIATTNDTDSFLSCMMNNSQYDDDNHQQHLQLQQENNDVIAATLPVHGQKGLYLNYDSGTYTTTDDDDDIDDDEDEDNDIEVNVNNLLSQSVFGSFRNLNNHTVGSSKQQQQQQQLCATTTTIMEPILLHFSDSFDDRDNYNSRRNESFRKSRSIPITSLFGSTSSHHDDNANNSNHSRRSTTAGKSFTSSTGTTTGSSSSVTKKNDTSKDKNKNNISRGLLLHKNNDERAPLTTNTNAVASVSANVTPGVPISSTYQNYLTAYKDHVATRKASLGKIV